MNTNTGQIRDFTEDEFHSLFDNKDDKEQNEWVEVSKKDMTKKQSKNNKVSLHDNRSKLGKQFTEIRKSRKMQRTQRR